MKLNIIAVILEESIRVASQFLTLLLGRWLYALSNPRKDYAWLLAQAPFAFSLRWYRGIELYHQLRGMRILYEYYTTRS
jgi:hypothetical protein